MDYIIKSPNQLSISLKNARKEAGLSQVSAAKDFGILQKTISLLENDPSKATIDSLFKLLAAIGYDMVLTPRSTDTTEWKEEW